MSYKIIIETTKNTVTLSYDTEAMRDFNWDTILENFNRASTSAPQFLIVDGAMVNRDYIVAISKWGTRERLEGNI